MSHRGKSTDRGLSDPGSPPRVNAGEDGRAVQPVGRGHRSGDCRRTAAPAATVRVRRAVDGVGAVAVDGEVRRRIVSDPDVPPSLDVSRDVGQPERPVVRPGESDGLAPVAGQDGVSARLGRDPRPAREAPPLDPLEARGAGVANKYKIAGGRSSVRIGTAVVLIVMTFSQPKHRSGWTRGEGSIPASGNRPCVRRGRCWRAGRLQPRWHGAPRWLAAPQPLVSPPPAGSGSTGLSREPPSPGKPMQRLAAGHVAGRSRYA